jgi:hypothetical protein
MIIKNLEPYPFTEQEADFLLGCPFPGVKQKEGEASTIIGGPLKLNGQQGIKVKVRGKRFEGAFRCFGPDGEPGVIVGDEGAQAILAFAIMVIQSGRRSCTVPHQRSMRPLAWMHGDVQLFENYAELGLGEGLSASISSRVHVSGFLVFTKKIPANSRGSPWVVRVCRISSK